MLLFWCNYLVIVIIVCYKVGQWSWFHSRYCIVLVTTASGGPKNVIATNTEHGGPQRHMSQAEPNISNIIYLFVYFLKKYFTSYDPHHDIYTFSYWQIFWHSIWHIFWHSIWHIFWHMFWHIFWHSIWQIFWHIFWHSIWHCIWHIFWHSIWHIFWHILWHIFWHSIWHSI